VFALTVLAGSCFLAAALVVNPVMAACAISSGSTVQYWVDGVYYNDSSVSGVKANLGAMNPDPVFSTYAEGGTSFWIMIAYDTSVTANDRVAQIGWMKASNENFNDPYIFLQIWPDTGVRNRFTVHPNCSANYWGALVYAESCKATASADYTVEKNQNGFYFKWGTFPSYTTPLYGWSPNQATVAGEIHNHGSSTTTDLGDHYPGYVGGVVQASSPRVRTGSVTYSSVNFLITDDHTGVAKVTKFGSPNTTFVQYKDPRCSS
jgi:hypothetical protein